MSYKNTNRTKKLRGPPIIQNNADTTITYSQSKYWSITRVLTPGNNSTGLPQKFEMSYHLGLCNYKRGNAITRIKNKISKLNMISEVKLQVDFVHKTEFRHGAHYSTTRIARTQKTVRPYLISVVKPQRAPCASLRTHSYSPVCRRKHATEDIYFKHLPPWSSTYASSHLSVHVYGGISKRKRNGSHAGISSTYVHVREFKNRREMQSEYVLEP